jgi:NADH dehydrogenase
MILITGASGFLGSHLARRLAQAGQRVRAMVRDRNLAEREGRLAGLPLEWVQADVTRPASLAPAMQGVSDVVHTVAIAIERRGRTYESTNDDGTRNVVEAAGRSGVRRFVHMSQLGARPGLPYRFLASKGRSEQHVTGSGLAWTILRPSVIWGPEDEFANTFARLALITPVFFPIIGDGQSRFQPVWVEDVASTVAAVLQDERTAGQTVELGGPEVLRLEEIERRALRAVGARRVLLHAPLPLIRIAVSLMEALLPSPPVTRSLLDLLAVDNTVAENHLRRFVPDPRAFTAEAASEYLRGLRPRDTLRALLTSA